MGIQFARSYKTSNEQCFASLEAAQIAEMVLLLKKVSTTQSQLTNDVLVTAATLVVENRDQFLDILTTTDSSRPKARKVNGGSKPRKKAPASTAYTAPSYSDIARLEEVASQVKTEAQRVLQAQ